MLAVAAVAEAEEPHDEEEAEVAAEEVVQAGAPLAHVWADEQVAAGQVHLLV